MSTRRYERWQTLTRTWRRMLRFVVVPGNVAAELSREPKKSAGAVAVLHLGAIWAAFCAVLYGAGHAPSMALLPIPRAHYYFAQALFVVPVTLGLWWLASFVTFHVAGERERVNAVFHVVGFAYAVPMLVGFVLVDVLVFTLFGFDGLRRYIRYYAGVAPLWAVVSGAIGLRRAIGVTWRRAIGAVLLGMLAQALIGGVFLR